MCKFSRCRPPSTSQLQVQTYSQVLDFLKFLKGLPGFEAMQFGRYVSSNKLHFHFLEHRYFHIHRNKNIKLHMVNICFHRSCINIPNEAKWSLKYLRNVIKISLMSYTAYWSIFTNNIWCGTLHKGDRTAFILEKNIDFNLWTLSLF
jgi:hypothetical protein